MVNFFNKHKKIILITIGILLLTGATFFAVQYLRLVTLEVVVDPADSFLYVDQKSIPQTPASLKLNRGKHKIQVNKDGYFSDNREVDLNRNTKLTIKLTPLLISKIGTTIDTTNLINASFNESNILVGINTQTHEYTEIDPSTKKSTTIKIPVEKPINSFTLHGNFLLLQLGNIDDLTNDYSIYNLTTKELIPLNTVPYQPIISITLDEKTSTVFFLGKYNAKTNRASLFKSELDNLRTTEVANNLLANYIVKLANNKVLLVETSDSANHDRASIFELVSQKNIPFIVAPNYIKKPIPNSDSALLAYISNTGLVYTNTETKETGKILSSVDPTLMYTWIDGDTLVIANLSSYTIQRFNVSTQSLSDPAPLPRLSNMHLVSIIKYKERLALLFTSEDRKTFKVILP